jgi:hypothetical protein
MKNNENEFIRGKPVDASGEQGMLTRSGKGVSSVISTLLSYPESVIVLYFKGENSNMTSGARAKFGKVYRWESFKLSSICNVAGVQCKEVMKDITQPQPKQEQARTQEHTRHR